MEIIILRHGKPKIAPPPRLSASEFGLWIKEYNKAGIDDSHAAPPEIVRLVKSCSVVVCSDFPRSIESAISLGVKTTQQPDMQFRECEMPYANWYYPKLPIMVWVVIFRILHFFGYSSNAESFKAAKQRAHNCALRLSELAHHHKSVLFVGHGLLNWLISKRLQRTGWVGPRSPGHKYWGHGIYRYTAT